MQWFVLMRLKVRKWFSLEVLCGNNKMEATDEFVKQLELATRSAMEE